MTTPPDESDFLALFESEPSLLDPGTPWVYNTATYQIERGGYAVELQISPSYSTLKVALTHQRRLVADVEIRAFTQLKIQSDSETEILIARFGELSASAMFLTVKPNLLLTTVIGSDA